jgi:putative NIF3 family GTP cyclohydrolase 1 type 2
MELSRRDAMLATAAVLSTNAGAAAPLTAAEVIARIKAHVGIPWLDKTVDGIIAGNAATPVTGIATTMMATFDALKAAVAARKNMVITHEPTFWSHQDNVTERQSDPLYLEKLDYIKRHDIVSFHFHDHWHGLKPIDGIAIGMMRQLGWVGYVDPANPKRFTLPPTTLENLARELETKLDARTLRVVGDPQLPVTRALASWGYVGGNPAGIGLINSDADVLIVGETWEWELVEYAQDLVSAGRKKGLIIIGHVASEQWGMKYCAEWLKGFVPEVPVEFIPLREPYWGMPSRA